MMNTFVIDTVAFINYHRDIFIEEEKISHRAREIINNAFDEFSNVKLVVPSVVFLEIHAKFLRSEELVRRFKYEVFQRVKESPDIEIKPIEKNVLTIFTKLDDSKIKLEHNDKLILSSAIDIDAPLITIDSKICKYVQKYKNLPEIIN